MDKEQRRQLTELAARQRGLFSAAQAGLIGLTRMQLSRAEDAGQLRRARRGVYSISGTTPSRWEGIISAALAAGPGAVISHLSAALVHNLYCAPPPGSDALVELTVPTDRAVVLDGARVHRKAAVDKADIVSKYGVCVSTPARALADLAGRLSLVVLERSIDEALLARQMRIEDLSRCLKRLPLNLAGRAKLERLVDLRAEASVADSMLEMRALRALQPLAPFEVHYIVPIGGGTFVVDAAWPAERVAAEVDGWRPRAGSRLTFERERRKLNAMGRAGWRVVHLTSTMSDQDMVNTVRTHLGSAPL